MTFAVPRLTGQLASCACAVAEIKKQAKPVKDSATIASVAAISANNDKVIGDLQAQLAACRSAEREMTALFERYGVDTVLAYGDIPAELHDLAVDESAPYRSGVVARQPAGQSTRSS